MEYIYGLVAALVSGAATLLLLQKIFMSNNSIHHTKHELKRPTELRHTHVEKNRIVALTNMILPQSQRDAEALRKHIARAGLSLSPTSYHSLSIMFCSSIVCFVAVLLHLFGFPLDKTALALVLCALFVLVIPRMLLILLAHKRAESIRSALPKALDLIAVGVEAGLTMERAMRLFAQENSGPLAKEFKTVDQEINVLGFSRTEALDRMARRCKIEDLSLFIAALNSSAEAGSPIARILHTQSETAFEKRRQFIEEQGNKLTSKMILPMGLFLVPAVLIAAIAPMLLNITSNAGGVI